MPLLDRTWPTAMALQGSDIDTKWPSYLDQYAAWLQTAFPQAAPQLVNKAQSGSTSNIFDACAEAMVPKVRRLACCCCCRCMFGCSHHCRLDAAGGWRGCCCHWYVVNAAAAGLLQLGWHACVGHLVAARPHVCMRMVWNFSLPLRLSSMQDADIVIAEFAMNDGTQAACKGDGSGSVPARASFERLIRKLQVGSRLAMAALHLCICEAFRQLLVRLAAHMLLCPARCAYPC